MTNETQVMPAVALRGITILPDMIVHFDISRAKSIRAVEEAMLGDQKIFLITQKDPDTEVPGLLDVYKIGTIAVIKQVVRMPKDVLRILRKTRRTAELRGRGERVSPRRGGAVYRLGRNAVFRYRAGGNAAQLKRAVCRLLRADAESQQGTGRPDPRNRRSWKAGGSDLHESAPRLRKCED